MVAVRDPEDLRKSALEHLWMHSGDWIEMAEEGGPDIIMEAKGIRVTDSLGKTWIDVHGGYGSVNLGYGRTEIAEAARNQMLKMSYFPNGTTTEPLVRLTEKLGQITPGDLERTWAVCGGSEANETSVKIARAYHRRNGEPGRYKIISRRGSYHGATGGTMFLGGRAPNTERSTYEPAYPGMVHAPQPNPYRCELGGRTPSECAVLCAQAVEDLIEFHGPSTVAAFIGEPQSGAATPGPEYWPMVREICDRYGVILIADEVVTGFCRTGKWFGMEHWEVVPDIMSLAKGIVSSYLPFGASIASKKVADAFAGEENIFQQVLTNGGHPVSAAAALKNIELMEKEGIVQNSAETGAYFLEQIQLLKDEHPIIGDARGLGLLLALELVSDRETKAQFPEELNVGARLNGKFRQRGLLIPSGGTLVPLAPPLCITPREVDEIVGALDEALGEMERELGISRAA